MGMKYSSVLCLSIDQNILKIAHVKGSGRAIKILQVVSKDISGVPEDQLPQAISSALGDFKVKGALITFVVPQSLATTKNIEIPSVNEKEIKSIVDLQAGRHTPFSREEIQVGYINFGVYNNNYSKILLVITQREELKKYVQLLEKAGAQVKKILFSPEGIAKFYSQMLGLKSTGSPTAIIDIGKNATDFIVVFKGTAIAVRNIPFGKSQMSQEGEAAIQKLTDELAKTMESYQNEDIEKAPERYVVTSVGEHVTALQTRLKEQLHWEVETQPYIDLIKVSPAILNRLGMEASDVSFLDVLAAGTNVSDAKIDLMPEEIQLQKFVEQQGKEIFKTAILGFVILILVASALGIKLFSRINVLNKLKKDYSPTRQEVAALEDLSLRSGALRSYLEGRMVSLDTVNELYSKIPDEIYLTGLQINEDGTVSIQGISDIPSSVFSLGTILKESTLFKSVEVKSTTAKKDRGKDVSAFEITLKLKFAADDPEEKKSNQTE